MKQLPALSTILFLICGSISQAQQPMATDTNVVVPPLVNFGGVLTESNGKPITVETPVTFMLYQESQGGSPLWMESQNVKPDSSGHYSVMLGATSSQGLPAEIFVAGQAHWLAVQVQGQEEQPRVLLVSAPYALKAGDAETIGGLPASAFVLANGTKQGVSGTSTAGTRASSNSSKTSAPPANPTVTGKGVAGYVPVWDTPSDIVDSVMFQKSSQIGFGTTSPTATIDVNGKGNVRDTLTLFAKSTDNTLAVSGTTFKISSNGTVTFISGQKFPGTGTITGVTTSSTSGLQGGGTTGTLNLSVKPAGVTNAMLQNSNVTLNANTAGGLTTPGAMTLGSTYTIGLKPCSPNQVLQYNSTSWNCATAGTGTITGVKAGSGLTGGGTSGNVTLGVSSAAITNAMLQNPSLTVTAGTGLTGGGAIALGGTTTLNINASVIPQLNASNIFTQPITVNATNSAGGVVNATSPYQAIIGTMTSNVTGSSAVTGNSSATGAGTTYGVYGASATDSGAGVLGLGSGVTGAGIFGYSSSGTGAGVHGQSAQASTLGAGSGNVAVWGDSSAGVGVAGTTDGPSPAVYGESFSGDGVDGSSNSGFGVGGGSSSGIGVEGNSYSNLGIWGFSSTFIGTEGIYNAQSSTGNGFTRAGVWGDSGVSGSLGVLGTTDDGNSLFGKNNSLGHETLYAENDYSDGVNLPLAARFAGSGGTTWCEIYMGNPATNTGDLLCTGAKSAAVPVAGNRMVRLYAVEAADNWFEDFGAGQLVDGKAAVNLDHVFAQTVNGDVDYHVFLTPNGDCDGLYVASKGPHGFEVRELRGGHSSISFDYRITARRKGYENVRMEDVTAHFELAQRNAQAREQSIDAYKAAHKNQPQIVRPPVLPRNRSGSAIQPISLPTPPSSLQK